MKRERNLFIFLITVICILWVYSVYYITIDIKNSLKTSYDKSILEYKKKVLVKYIKTLTHQDYEVIEIVLDKLDKVLKENDFEKYKNLIIAIIITESGFSVKCKSSVAYGLCQINFNANKNILKNIGVFSPVDLYDIDKNLNSCVAVLKHMLEISKGNIKKALNIYSGDKTGKYTIKVLSLSRNLKYIFED